MEHKSLGTEEDRPQVSCATEEGTGKWISSAPFEQAAMPKAKVYIFVGDREVQKGPEQILLLEDWPASSADFWEEL